MGEQSTRLKVFFKQFAEGTLGRRRVHGQWSVSDDSYLRFTSKTGDQETLAIRQKDGTILLNSSIFQSIGSYVVWGHRKRTWGETWHQRFFREEVPCIPVPFNALAEAGISEQDLYFSKILEWGGAEQVQVAVTYGTRFFSHTETRHYTGAALIEVPTNRSVENPEGTPTKLLFDIDRQELQYGKFNPFVSQLFDGCAATTIAEAYRSLEPEEVRKYRASLASEEHPNRQVVRQGDLFFIPIPGEPPPAPVFDDATMMQAKFKPSYSARALFASDDEFKEAEEKHREAFELAISAVESPKLIRNTHWIEKAVIRDGKTYARGKVEHSRRQHHELYLGETWYLVVPNTAVRNFLVTGAID